MPYTHYHHSPIGVLKITAEEACITGLSLCTEEKSNEVSTATKEYSTGKQSKRR